MASVCSSVHEDLWWWTTTQRSERANRWVTRQKLEPGYFCYRIQA